MSVTILTGDCRDVLATLPDESVHCVVTSPPYWGLRDYGTATWDGGDPDCSHLREIPQKEKSSSTLERPSSQWPNQPFKGDCGKCGARRIDNQLGLERSLGEHVETITAVFREVRRVLRKDGTLWLNYGDSYAGSYGNQGRKEERGTQRPINGGMLTPVHDGRYPSNISGTGSLERSPGLKAKDLCGIPWRVAFALQANGWYLRSDIIWSKPNPIPESVTDRPTKAHEYLFLLTKSERYYYDAEAIKEPNSIGSIERKTSNNKRDGRSDGTKSNEAFRDHVPLNRNRRTVWEIPTSPFPEAHFATFPPALVEPCIKAGTSEKGCCAKCGSQWIRDFQRNACDPQRSGAWKATGENHRNDIDRKGGFYKPAQMATWWLPSCKCDDFVAPCTVLDPFGGAGTTGLVADRLGRNAILIELNPDYAEMAERRIKGDAPLFADVSSGSASVAEAAE